MGFLDFLRALSDDADRVLWPGLHTLFVSDPETGEKVMTHTKLRLAIAALGDVHPSTVPRGDVHDLLEKYDQNFNGMDMKEFTVSLLHQRTGNSDTSAVMRACHLLHPRGHELALTRDCGFEQAMMRDLIEQRTVLTDFESLQDCSVQQLQTLKVSWD